MGFITHFSGHTFGLIPLSIPCTAGRITLLDFAYDLVFIKHFHPPFHLYCSI